MRLTRDEKAHIHRKTSWIEGYSLAIELVNSVANKFKIGDYVVAYWPEQTIDEGYDENRPPQLIMGPYDIVQKYIVVHVGGHGIPYIKKLNKNNKPYGELNCPINIGPHHGDCRVNFILQVDPDYTDAILLDNEKDFNATQSLKNKTDLRQEIVDHNKKIKVKLDSLRDVQVFYSNIKAGDILWRSTKSSISVVEVIVRPKISGGVIHSLKVLTNKNKEIIYRTSQLVNMNLYTDQPRGFSELRDPK